jgi:glycosyltransferase involved in cell wall biosynthesis
MKTERRQHGIGGLARIRGVARTRWLYRLARGRCTWCNVKLERSTLFNARVCPQCRREYSRVLEDASVILKNRMTSGTPTAGSLVILDDAFPHLLSAFRIAEFNRYLAAYPDALVYSTASALWQLQEERSFSAVVDEYERRYPQFAGRVFKFNRHRDLRGALVYSMFAQNTFRFLPTINEQNLPFVFTLYPGSGLQLDDPSSDARLRAIFASPNFRRVIVTQKITQQYLLDGGFCSPERIAFVYGGVFPSDHLANGPARRRYREDKPTFDVCFVAHKYMERGLDKGFDLFAAVAAQLARVHPDIQFHVVGNFDAGDLDVGEMHERIVFHGQRPTDFFPGFYAGMDLILSPNVPFRLLPGAFDGFPTGGCMEAGLCGVAVFATDPLNLNVAFKDGEEIVIIPHSVDDICTTVDRHYRDYPELCALAKRGQAAFQREFDIEMQMAPRLRLLAESLSSTHVAQA